MPSRIHIKKGAIVDFWTDSDRQAQSVKIRVRTQNLSSVVNPV
jgi:hypothetical protein